MADLKAGTTIGGTLVWTQGNFPLFPTGNTLVYKTFKVYSENDKPQAVDNDFVSKAAGGTYLGPISAKSTIYVNDDPNFRAGGIKLGNGDASDIATCNVDIASWNGLGFWSTQANKRTIAFDVRNGGATFTGGIYASGNISSAVASTQPQHLTRKDYVDNAINTVTNNANSKVSKSGDTMTGPLTVPTIFLTNDGTQPNHVVRYSQVVLKGVILDYGTF